METITEAIEVGGRVLSVERPVDAEALLDEDRFADEEFLPYWAESWPSGLALARHIATLDLSGRRVLELGCGLGLPSLVAAAGGAEVLATDWAPEAIELLRANAARNDLALRAERLDWRDVAVFVERGPFDLALAADVAYEQRNGAPLASLLLALGAEALVADPGRAHLPALLAALAAAGTAVETLEAPTLRGGAIHRLRPRPGS